MKRKAAMFDFNRTLFDIERGVLYEGVQELLEEQQKMRRLILYSRQEGGRKNLLRDLGIDRYFEATYFVKEKTAENVREILQTQALAPDQCFVVGDLITSELAAGNSAGLETVWLKHGKFADIVAKFEPTYTVRTISELRELLKTLP